MGFGRHSINNQAMRTTFKSTDIAPGECVLANRIRMCIPASHRDELLPTSDDQLMLDVCNAEHVSEVHNGDAKHYVAALVLENVSSWDPNEVILASRRIRSFFSGEVVA